MFDECEDEKKAAQKNNFKKTALLAVVVIGVVLLVIGIKKIISSESQTTEIGFENIGELATQSFYCTQVNVTDSSKKLFDLNIPFTNSKYIYSYGVNIKAGYDFGEIHCEVQENSIVVEMPEAKILSSEIDQDSFKVYLEDESIFNQISLEENNESMKKLKEQAEADAIESGLLDNARSNAETILTGFLGNLYDLNQYQIVFRD